VARASSYGSLIAVSTGSSFPSVGRFNREPPLPSTRLSRNVLDAGIYVAYTSPMSKTPKRPDTLPALLLAARKRHGMRQSDAAQIMGVTAATVSRWESRQLGFHPAMRERVEKWVAYWLEGSER